MVRILSTADIHSPRYLDLFMKSLEKTSISPDIIILAGDLVDKNNVYALKPVYNALLKKFPEIPIISVFGNEEYRGYEDRYKSMYPLFRWLNDEYLVLEVSGQRIGIIGTRGALDKPTPWQSRHMPWVRDYYRKLPLLVSKLIDRVRNEGVKIVVLVSHYGVTYSDLEGEPRNIWPYLASSKMEKVIISKKVDLVIHGHAHNAVKTRIKLSNTYVYNVSLPANRELVIIDYIKEEKPHGLDRWLK
ncbi:MAG TPA: metallophosphoesterase [Euryarchaeota archaeon]|nr:metallophosphoesterase [Euryarchaeota archaeon]